MKLNQNSDHNHQDICNINKKLITFENDNYLYPNGHRIIHQMRWFKGSRHRGLNSDIAA